MIKILFVCMGNICRSPTAEGCMKQHLLKLKQTSLFKIESAGTIAHHSGQPPDLRTQQQALKNNINLSLQRARQVTQSDFKDFDYIVAMDRDNLTSLESSQPENSRAHLSLLTEWFSDSKISDVPDPYYGGSEGFKVVFDLINKSTECFLQKLLSK